MLNVAQGCDCLVHLNSNFELCDRLIDLSDNKLSDDKLSNNKLFTITNRVR